MEIFVYTLVTYSLDNYDTFYTCLYDTCSSFIQDHAFVEELTKALHAIEEELIGSINIPSGNVSLKSVQAFGLLAGNILVQSTLLADELKTSIVSWDS